MLKEHVLLLLAALLLAGCSGERERPAPTEADVERARMALQPFKKDLMAALTLGLEDSPGRAIEVCRSKAPEIAARQGRAGLRMGRTSHRLRNLDNAPPSWTKPLLDAYAHGDEKRPYQTVWVDDETIGYVEPIATKPLCLICHGENIPESIREQLAKLYPGDAATGFRPEEFRGLFWVTMPASAPSD